MTQQHKQNHQKHSIALSGMAMLLGACLLAGCQSGKINPPDQQTPTDIDHKSQKTTNQITATRGWGEILQQPLLDDWIQVARSNSSQQRVADKAVQLASAQSRTTAAQRSPALRADLTVRGGQEQNAMTQNQADDLEPFVFGLYGTWNLDVFRRIRSQVDAAESAKIVAQHESEQVQLDLAATIASHYIEGLFLHEQIDIRQQMLTAQENILRYLRARVDKGLAPPALLDQAVAKQSDIQSGLARVCQTQAENDNMWQHLIQTNLAPVSTVESGQLPDRLPPVPPASQLHATARQRPEVQAAYAMLEGLQSEAVASRRNRLPELSLVSVVEGDTPSPVEEPEDWIAWAGVRLSLPLLSPERGANTKVSEARLQQQKAVFEDTLNIALLDLRDSYTKRTYAEAQWHTAQERANRMRQRFESNDRKHKKGLISVLILEQARIAWLSAQEQERKKLATTLQQHIALVRAHGGP